MSKANEYSAVTSALIDALGGKLTRKHAAELAASAISPEVAQLRGYLSFDKKQTSALTVGYGLQPYQAKPPGYVLPIFDVHGQRASCQFKPDNPRKSKGKVIKYETPEGARNVLDCPAICQPDLGKPAKPLWITEGIKKADAAASKGACVIGLAGVWGWCGTNSDSGRTALVDWRSVALNDGRLVFIAYDSDAVQKIEVQRAEQDLAKFLTSRGAKVALVRIPPGRNGEKVGLDDYLATGGTLDDLVVSAISADGETNVVEATLSRLASLPAVEYELERGPAADGLGIRVSAVDRFVAERREAIKGAAAAGPDIVPAAEPVEGAELVPELIKSIQRFVMVTYQGALVTALWILFTWVFEAIAETNPYLRIVAPAEECGKSTLLKVIKWLSRRGWIVSKITASSFTRTMENERRTLLLDEGDAFLNENEVMRNVLDAASDPDTATISMSVKIGDDWVPKDFNVFVPIAIASIGMLRQMRTVESRSIHIHLKRATPAELKSLAKGRRRELKATLEPLAAKCARWAADNAETLKGARPPTMPENMSGREMDKWEPLLAISDLIGGEHAKLASAAASTNGERRRDASLPELLLADLKALFDERDSKALASIDICQMLADLEDRPWGEMGRARKPLTQRGLAGLLRGFGVVPGSVQLDDKSTPKGYKRSDLEDAFTRYQLVYTDLTRQSDKPAGAVGESDDFQNANDYRVGRSKNATFLNGEKDFDASSDENPLNKHGDIHNGVEKDGGSVTEGLREAEIDRLTEADEDDPPQAGADFLETLKALRHIHGRQ